ncbi:MAG TPA: transposase [Novosphingobium sp.]|nr:transposase [Novosphingobium sp.]
MARLIAANDPTSASLAQVCEALAVWDFDPSEEESVAHAANWLRRLGNDRDFLGDMLIDLLAERSPAPGGATRLTGFGGGGGSHHVVLAAPGRGHFSIRASICPSQDEPALRASGAGAFGYGIAKDYNHDFLTLGYFGPGVAIDDYEYLYPAVAGWSGEPVELRPLGRSRLEPGHMRHYRAHRDVNVVHPPPALSVALSLSHEHAANGWMDHYVFDLEGGRVARVLGHGPSEAFLRIAVALGGQEALDLATRFGRHHPSDRMRLVAWRALAGLAGGIEAQDRVWREAEGCGSRVVAAVAARRRAVLG